jgi:hypothetical protein
MSTATLNVWITNIGDPCTIVNAHPWVVVVQHCDGRVLNWSEGRYRHHREDEWIPIPPHTPQDGTKGWWYESIPTHDGHVQIEVPPGCYVLVASQHVWFSNGVLWGNWKTDHAIVQAGCGQDVCATLYAPSTKACWEPLHFVIQLLMRHQIIGREEGEQAIEAMRAVFDRQPSRFERNELETLRRAFEQMGKEISEKGEEKGEC